MAVNHAWNSLRETFEARASEWALSVVILSLAFVAFVNTTLFQSDSFSVMRSWADQYTWGWVFMILGGTRILVLAINGAWWRTPAFRMVFAFLSSGLWFHLLWGLGANFAIGFAVFPSLFALDMYNSLRAGREAGIAYFIHKHALSLTRDVRTNNNS